MDLHLSAYITEQASQQLHNINLHLNTRQCITETAEFSLSTMASSQNTPDIPSAKRRRVDAANATLKKPFRSPMINRQAQQSPTATTSGINATPTRNSPSLARSTNPLSRPPTSIPATPSRPAAPSPLRLGSNSTVRRPLLLQKSFKPVSSPSPLKQRQQNNSSTNHGHGDLLQRIQRSHRDLDLQMKKVEKELELVRQARRIEGASRRKRPGAEVDAELKELIGKWKVASRQAAEELFEVVKGRVDGMGGAGAWRESRKRRFGDWDDEPGGKKRVEGDGEEDEGLRSELEGEDCEHQGQKEEEGDDAEGFTMLMMLKSLNIEPEVLGWDPGEEKWKD
ncbi:hypothetical protein QBC40DRAFT_284700 [Triangularia verruculosa]|uniref:Swi5-dependent recombination DNA repair protein 1 n=1 Tax=Triangularia verruculosa TaxID=2587418 RepID=A0AAN7ASU6_9PEZI|nr:hypothetical protein QBC40DRAFT_284700 [Triangularia verruculosa]